MEFGRVHEELLQVFPELLPAYRQLLDSWRRADPPGQYIFFEDVFGRYVEFLLSADPSAVREEKVRAVFEFVELMLADGGEVENLAYVGLLEGRPGVWLQAAKPHLGELAMAALDRFSPGWRAEPSSRLDFEIHDLYGIEAIADGVLRGAR